MDAAELYALERRRLADLLREAGPEAADATVPASPDWTVKDVVAHLCGIAVDTVEGRVEGVGSDPWTAAQVEARRDVDLDGVLAEWDQRAPGFVALLRQLPPHVGAGTIGDLMTHVHDVRGALGQPGERDGEAVALATDYYVERFRRRAAKRGLPPLLLEAGGRSWRIDGSGEGEAATASTDPFELVRALSGRRTSEEIRAWAWSADPAPWLDALSSYGTPSAALVE